MSQLQPETLEKAKSWLSDTFDKDTREKIKSLIDNNPEELKESFYKNLEFGTGGMRGIMGVGTNRINKYTLGKNTQGISNYLKKSFPGEELKVAIAYDCRNNSKELARVVADVFSANDIQVYLFKELRPTPELSFAVKHLNCHSGIVLTASHNPPEYNGYKVYWQDGGQLVPPQDKEIIEEIEALDYDAINFSAKEEKIKFISKEVDEAFITASVENGTFEELEGKRDATTIVFTNLHGTAGTLIPDALKKTGYKNVHEVESQKKPDGNFPTVESPNPEEPEALSRAMELAEEKNADIVIGTDPDGDRLGIAVRDTSGKLVILNGNQTMVVMTDFLLKKHFEDKAPAGNEFIGSTIVSTPMMEVLAKSYDVECKLGLTGFKWIAKMIKDNPNQKFIGGGEESFGYMVGDFVRDKDAVTATLLACEITSWAKTQGTSFYELLLDLYVKHDFFKEDLTSLVKKGISGAEEIKQTMIDMRENPVSTLGGEKVVQIDDYLSSISLKVNSGVSTKIDVPKSNVLIYHTEKGSRVAARPSGTEPKIKFYISVNGPLDSVKNKDEVEKSLDLNISGIKTDLGL